MFIYTVFLKEYLKSTTIVTHMKSFTSYPPAEAYAQELQKVHTIVTQMFVLL